jgi:RHS repeat-associated protein
VDNDYLFTGRRLDADTGDYYYRARYYNSEFGQFGAVDRYAPDEMTYGYAGGNPVMMVDPLGLDARNDTSLNDLYVSKDGKKYHLAPGKTITGDVDALWIKTLHLPKHLDKKKQWAYKITDPYNAIVKSDGAGIGIELNHCGRDHLDLKNKSTINKILRCVIATFSTLSYFGQLRKGGWVEWKNFGWEDPHPPNNTNSPTQCPPQTP